MPVGKELVVAPKTLFGIHTVFGEKRVSAVLLYGPVEPRSQFFDDVMDGGYPYPPSDVMIRHVTCVDLDYI